MFMPQSGKRDSFGGKPEKGNFLNNPTMTMLEKYSLAQKKAAIIIFGILVVVIASVNRLFLQNAVMSAIVVVLSIVFLLVLIWFSIHSRSITFKNVPKRTKHAEDQKFVH
jgi:hypothetical protein